MRIIKRLKSSDFHLVLNMNKDFRDGFAYQNEAQAFLTDENHLFYACIINEKIVGFVYGYVLKRLNSKPMAYVHEVGVLNEFKKQNVATDLITCMKHDLFAEGIVKIFLITQKQNIAACNLYEKMGGVVMSDVDYGLCDVTYVFKSEN